jgi:hypothetical protein
MQVGDNEQNLNITSILGRVLTGTEMNIISTILEIHQRDRRPVVASEILLALSSSSPIKKTQLYCSLKRLTKLGFLQVKELPRPRKYIASCQTIIAGFENWLSNERTKIRALAREVNAFSIHHNPFNENLAPGSKDS